MQTPGIAGGVVAPVADESTGHANGPKVPGSKGPKVPGS
jgi:hypothetical protein